MDVYPGKARNRLYLRPLKRSIPLSTIWAAFGPNGTHVIPYEWGMGAGGPVPLPLPVRVPVPGDMLTGVCYSSIVINRKTVIDPN